MRTAIFLIVTLIGIVFFARWFFRLEMNAMWRAAGIVLGGVSATLFIAMIGTLFLNEFLFMIFVSLGFSGTSIAVLSFNMITHPEWFVKHFMTRDL